MSKKPSNNDYFCPIDLNNLFDDQDTLDPWIIEVDEPLLDGQSGSWVETRLRVFATPEGIWQQQQQGVPDLHMVPSLSSSDGGDGSERKSNSCGSNYGNDMNIRVTWRATQGKRAVRITMLSRIPITDIDLTTYE